MLNAITPAQIAEMLLLLEQMAEARHARAGKEQSVDELSMIPAAGSSRTICMG